MELFKFEVKKIISSKKFIVLWSICILLISLYVLLSYNANKVLKSSEIDSYKVVIDNLNINSIDLSNRIALEKDSSTKKSLEEALINCKESIKLNENIKDGIINDDYIKVLNSKIKIQENIKKTSSFSTLEDIEANIERYNYLLENKIKPINEGTDMNAVNFINLVLKYIAPMFIGIIIILTTSDIVSKELDYGTMQTLLFQRLTRKKIIFIKLVASTFINILISFTSIISIAVILCFINEVGSFNYPVILKIGQSLSIVPISNIIIKNCIVLILLIIFLTCFSSLISTLVNNSTEALSIATTICVGSILIFNNINLPEKIKIINPFSYITGNDVLRNGFSSNPIISDVNILYVFIIFTIYIIIITMALISIFIKKQFDVES